MIVGYKKAEISEAEIQSAPICDIISWIFFREQLIPYEEYLFILHPEKYYELHQSIGRHKASKLVTYHAKKIPATYMFCSDFMYVSSIASYECEKHEVYYRKYE